jgi:hypothetical protein
MSRFETCVSFEQLWALVIYSFSRVLDCDVISLWLCNSLGEFAMATQLAKYYTEAHESN